MELNEVKKNIQDAAVKAIQKKASESEDGLQVLWDHELAQEISSNARNESAVAAIEPYVQPKCNVVQNGLSATIDVNFNPDKPLHPGLDTLSKIAIHNIMAKFKYNRGGDSNA